MFENYREPEDLLSDPSFLSWYFTTGERGYFTTGREQYLTTKEDDHRAWEEWRAGRPDRDILIKKAVALLEATRLPEKEPSSHQLQQAESTLLLKINALTPETRKGPTSIGRYRRIAAASVLVLLAAGVLITRLVHRSRPGMQTAFGQISRQQLPDGSEVMMNANSRISYAGDWKDGMDREVWVDGEVFFHVRKTPSKSRFIVHTEHFDIIVTGTDFNVSNRHGQDNVLLQEGSVTLRTKDGRTLLMKPGDFVTFDPAGPERKVGCKDMLLAWKEQKLILDHTSISQLATIISDLYGKSVILEGDSIAERKISGILPNNNLDILLQALEATAEYEVVRDAHDGITIRIHSPRN